MTFWPLRVLKMSMNKRKKTIFSAFLLGGLIYMIVQVTYYQQAYSPLRELANAESEAQRLLKFITLYHYQCNNSISSGNGTAWKLCTDSDTGINLDSAVTKISYSVGPLWDISFEQLLSRNLSFHQYIFIHYPIPLALKALNGTSIYKTVIVPNDPADFGRNSFETQTLNSIMKKLKHKQVDILKLESLLDMGNSHELLFYLVKDGLLSNVQQLHIVLDIDKIDDTYLYNWYRSLYILFHEAGFRLYHTSASDPLCLQVTMMESCRYFMSWVKNPGPRTFVLHPPAIDGSYELEAKRILGFLEEQEPSCHDNSIFSVDKENDLSLCMDILGDLTQQKCNIFIFGEKHSSFSKMPSSMKGCRVMHFLPRGSNDKFQFSIISKSIHHSASSPVSLSYILLSYFKFSQVNYFYISSPHIFWGLVTQILDSGALQTVNQFIGDVPILESGTEKNPLKVRQKYSELRRIESYGFRIYETRKLAGNAVNFVPEVNQNEDCCYRISFVKFS